MKGGFTFCGVDIEDIGLNYAPENKDTYVYSPGVENVHEETFEGHDGGYAYGAYKEPKEFILRCYYEEQHISKGVMAKAYSLFRVGKSGLLVFKRRPWCYYYVTVTNINHDEMYNYENGLIVVTMKAYYPYARGVEINGRMMSNLPTDPYHDEIMANTALLERDEMVPQTSFDSPPVNPHEIILLNPGTERAKVSLVIAGTAGDGVTIYNKTTDQMCRYVAFDTSNNEYVYTDGISGKTILDDGASRTLAFMYHDYGFIELAPAFPIKRKVFATYNGLTVSTTNILFEEDFQKDWYIGRYIYLGKTKPVYPSDDNEEYGDWYKIEQVTDKHTLMVLPRNGVVPGEGKCTTAIVKMNELIVTPTQDTIITKLNFIYKPTFA